MELVLTDAQAEALRTVLDDTLRDFSGEIADTDNASYREAIDQRRDRVAEVRALLGDVPPAT